MSANPAPGYKKYPRHRISTQPAKARVQVTHHGELIADTMDAVEMHETHEGHVVAPLVYYIPRKDAKMERLARSLKNGPENAVWTYEQPYDEMLAIKELLAFYPDKFEITAAPRAGQ